MSESSTERSGPRRVTDWAALWRELVQTRYGPHPESRGEGRDLWADRASAFDQRVRQGWTRPDSIRDHLIARMTPERTLLDIGAGTGTWAIPLAPCVRRVTAIEPSPAMSALLRVNLAERGIDNVTILPQRWPHAIEAHDFVLSAHAIYGVADLPAFLRAMTDTAKRGCFLLVRAPEDNGLFVEAARHVWGHPDAILGLPVVGNVLREMGIAASIQREDPRDTGDDEPDRTSDSLADALSLAKRWLAISESDQRHDAYLADLLVRRLVRGDEGYVWPETLGRALITWAGGVTALGSER